MAWRAANAKAKFSELLDTAASEGPQLVRRRKETFVITTEAEIEKRLAEARAGKRQKFVSIWEALRLPPSSRLTEDEYAVFSSAWNRR